MKRHALSLILAAIAALAIAGCGGGGHHYGNSDESRIRGRYNQLRDDIDRRSLDVMEVYSFNYLDGGYNYDAIRDEYAKFFDRYRNIDEHFNIQDIRVAGDFATVAFQEYFYADDTFNNGVPVKSDVGNYTGTWHYEHGDWFEYGNQLSAAPGAQVRPYSLKRPVQPAAKE